jgi:serine/threonine protein kinase
MILFIFIRSIFSAYMAPEIVEGGSHSVPVDIWSLGVLMYYVMTFQYPFFSLNPFALSGLIVNGDYKRIPNKMEGGIYSQELIDIVDSMLMVCE